MQALVAPFIFYIFLEQYEGNSYMDGNLPRYVIPLIIGEFLALRKSNTLFGPYNVRTNLVVAIFGTLHKAPPFYDAFVVLGFLIAVLWIGVTANEVVGLLSSLGVFWNIPSTIMGLTFLAWANSIGDLVADVSLSRIGKARTAVSFL